MKTPKLNAIARRFFSPALKTLWKAGFIDGDNELTEEGRETLEVIVLDKFMTELLKEAKKITSKKKKGEEDDENNE